MHLAGLRQHCMLSTSAHVATAQCTSISVNIVGSVLMNRDSYVSLGCTTKTYNLYQSSRLSLLNFKASIFIYAGWLRAYIAVRKDNHASHIWNQLRRNEKFI